MQDTQLKNIGELQQVLVKKQHKEIVIKLMLYKANVRGTAKYNKLNMV